jgi:hypothetical protein
MMAIVCFASLQGKELPRSNHVAFLGRSDWVMLRSKNKTNLNNIPPHCSEVRRPDGSGSVPVGDEGHCPLLE